MTTLPPKEQAGGAHTPGPRKVNETGTLPIYIGSDKRTWKLLEAARTALGYFAAEKPDWAITKDLQDAIASAPDLLAEVQRLRQANAGLLEACKDGRNALAAAFRVISEHQDGANLVKNLEEEFAQSEVKDGVGVRMQKAIAAAEQDCMHEGAHTKKVGETD